MVARFEQPLENEFSRENVPIMKNEDWFLGAPINNRVQDSEPGLVLLGFVHSRQLRYIKVDYRPLRLPCAPCDAASFNHNIGK
jgi:hypothetical protein